MTAGRPAVRYRPHLDGLRAVAVYLVVAFHAGLGRVDAGFIGVDVFFVLSGFLVTKLLVVDLVRRGRPDARRFYARRSRRILPAAILVLVATAVAYGALAPPSDVVEAMGGFRAASVYMANWFFIGQSTDYFASDMARSPVLHFWSLAIEEQFYLLWPLALGGLFMLARRFGSAKWVILRVVVAACAVASAVAAVLLADDNLARAYYGTDTRAYQLLAGALVALTPGLARLVGRGGRIAAASAVAAVAAIAVLATPLVGVGPITRGLLVTVATVVLIVALENARGGPVTAVLAAGPVTALGRVSYGTYLWHWPIIVLLALEAELAPLAVFAVAAVGATLLASVSYALMERPIRSNRRLDEYAIPVVIGGLAFSLMMGLFVMPGVLERAVSQALGKSGGGETLDWKSARQDIPPAPRCGDRPVEDCLITRGNGMRVLLMGDSTARMWIPAFRRIAQENDATLGVAVRPGCPWLLDVLYQASKANWRGCRVAREDWYERVVPDFDPDVIVLSQRDPYSDPLLKRSFTARTGDGSSHQPGSEEFASFLGRQVEKSIDMLSASHRRIVVLEPLALAEWPFDPIRCLSLHDDSSRCHFSSDQRPSPLEGILRSRDVVDPGMVSVDLDAIPCPREPSCRVVESGVIIWRDRVHLTRSFARRSHDRVEAALKRAGIRFRRVA